MTSTKWNSCKWNDKFLAFCRWALCWMCIVLFAGLSAINLFRTAQTDMDPDIFWNEFVIYSKDPLLGFILAAILMGLLFAFLYRLTAKMSANRLSTILTLLIFALGVFWVATVQLGPRADQQSVHTAAMHWLEHDFSDFDRGNYLFRFPYQMPYVAFLALFYRIVGSGNYEAVQVLNAALIALTYWGISKISQILFGEQSERRVILFSLGFWCGWMLSVFVYGNIPSFALAVLALWLQLQWQLCHKRWTYLAASGIVMGLSILLKSFSVIFFIAQSILLVLHFLRSFRWQVFIWMLCAVLCWQGGALGIHAWAEHQYGAPLNDGAPLQASITMGLQENPEGWRAPGWYNGYHYYLYEDMGYDRQRTLERSHEDLNNRLTEFKEDPAKMAYFFYKKTCSQWADPSAQSLWISAKGTPDKHGPLAQFLLWGKGYPAIFGWMNVYQSLLWLSGTAYLFVKRKQLTLEQLLPGLIVLGGFLFQLFWEGKSQYLLPYYMMALPYAALGFYAVVQKIQKGIAGKLRRQAAPQEMIETI